MIMEAKGLGSGHKGLLGKLVATCKEDVGTYFWMGPSLATLRLPRFQSYGCQGH